MKTNTQEINMVGIDVSKAKLDIAIDDKRFFTINNNPVAFNKFIKGLDKNAIHSFWFVMEATGGYETAFARFLLDKGFQVSVVNAKRVRDFARAMGSYAKTDRLDAQMIRQYAQSAFAQHHLQQREPRSQVEQKIEALLKRRQQLVGQRGIEKQHLESSFDSDTTRSIKRILKLLAHEIEKIETTIKSHIDKDPDLRQKIERLEGVKGIGKVNALVLTSLLPELGKVSNKEIAALVGVAPYSRDSGKKTGKRIIFGGRSIVRSALYMSILSAVRYNEAIRIFYQRLIANGKQKKVALTACMRKLLVIINSIIKNRVQWKPHFVN